MARANRVEECLCQQCMAKRVMLAEGKRHYMCRTCVVLRPQDVAGMFGGKCNLIDVRYDHERGVVEVVLEDLATGAEWWPGQSAYRVEARPLPTAYVMKGQWPRPA